MMDREWFVVVVSTALAVVALVSLPDLSVAQGYDTRLDKGGIDTRLDKGGIDTSVNRSGIDKKLDDRGIDTRLNNSGIDKKVDESGIDSPANVPEAPAASGPKIIHAPSGVSN